MRSEVRSWMRNQNSSMPNTTCCCVRPGVNTGHALFETKPCLITDDDIIFKGHLFPGRGYSDRKKASVKAGRCAGWTEEFCKAEVVKCQEVRKLIERFNKTPFSSTKIRSLVPRMAVMDDVAGSNKRIRQISSDEWVLIYEERINSVSERQDAATDVFTHFSYYATGGRLVASEFKGDNSDNQVVLVDSKVHSVNRQFGDSDKGTEGIKEAFLNHTCSQVCNAWPKPAYTEDAITSADKDISTINFAHQPNILSPSAPPLELYPISPDEQQRVAAFQNFDEQFEEQVTEFDALFPDLDSRSSVLSARIRQDSVGSTYSVGSACSPPSYSERFLPIYSEDGPPLYSELPPSYDEVCRPNNRLTNSRNHASIFGSHAMNFDKDIVKGHSFVNRIYQDCWTNVDV